jgi:serine/threonine protein kinase
MGEELQFPEHVDEAARRRFEASLAAKAPLPLNNYLPDVNDSRYVATLEELVAIAVEYSWKQWARHQESPFPRSLEAYLAQFPVLRREDILARLVQHVEDVRREVANRQLETSPIPHMETDSSPALAAHPGQAVPVNQEASASRLGQYQLLEPIGRGGMGIVHRAVHTRLQKQVAIKVLPAGRWSDALLVQRFEREMRAAGQLHHPNVVVTYDAGEVDGLHYLVMELVEGEDLETVLSRKQTISAPNACRIIHDVARALHHAHSKHLVHRDIKPSNIMLTHGGDVKLLDLGLALLTVCASESGDITRPNQCMGTLHYMAPEQAEDSHHVGTPADIYSLGATLYRLLTGESPHGSKNAAPLRLLAALQRGEFTPLEVLVPHCPPELSRLVGRMLSRDPSGRPNSAAEVADSLEPFASGADLAKLMQPSTDSEESSLTVPPPQDSLLEAPSDGSSVRNSDRRPGFRVDWWPVCLVLALATTVLVAAVVVRHWGRGATPVSSILVQFPPVTRPEIMINGRPAELIAVQPGLVKVLVDQVLPTDLKIDVRGEGFLWHVGEPSNLEAQATADQLTLQAWPLLPQDQVIDWIRGQGGDAIVWDELGHSFFLSSLPDVPISETWRVTRVVLAGTSTADEDLWRLDGLRELVELNLAKTNVSDLGLGYLVNLRELLYLNLVDTQIRGPGLAYLNRLPSLHQLFLSRTAVDDEGLEHLSGARLTQLTLDGTRVSPRSLSLLSRMSNLRQLNLMDLGFDEQHLESLRATLPACEIYAPRKSDPATNPVAVPSPVP